MSFTTRLAVSILDVVAKPKQKLTATPITLYRVVPFAQTTSIGTLVIVSLLANKCQRVMVS